jgi:formylglycine-generating enzyme required for sulfatase activity
MKVRCILTLLVVVWQARGDGATIAAPPPAVAPFPAEQARQHQEAWARHLGTSVETTNLLGMTLVLIPPGEFRMGSSADQTAAALEQLRTVPRVASGEADRIRNEEQPQHRVVLTRPIRIGRTEVTLGQFRRFVDDAKYATETERFGGGNSAKIDEADPNKRGAIWNAPGYPVTDDSPVTQITWGDMTAFCNWLSRREGRRVCYEQAGNRDARQVAGADGYRLPTEAEWEFACRAGTTTHYSFGDDVAQLDHYAWFNRTAEVGREFGARPVATKRPNPFGLYDMHGNAWERCQDFHAADAYAISAVEDPPGPPSGVRRIARGGGWHYFDLHCRSAYRNNYAPDGRTANIGFRVVVVP